MVFMTRLEDIMYSETIVPEEYTTFYSLSQLS
jgi:hypothetical protein